MVFFSARKKRGYTAEPRFLEKKTLRFYDERCLCRRCSLLQRPSDVGSVGLEKWISPEGWVQYSSEDAGFKVSFPTDPEAASKELVIPDSGKVLNYEEITSAEDEKVRYSVTHINLPRKWRSAGNTTLLKGVLDQLIQHTEGAELIEKEFKMYGSHRVLDFRLKEGKNEVKGRLIIVGGTLYRLTIAYPPSHAKELQGSPFLESFEIS